jgi:hypothetical protein
VCLRGGVPSYHIAAANLGHECRVGIHWIYHKFVNFTKDDVTVVDGLLHWKEQRACFWFNLGWGANFMLAVVNFIFLALDKNEHASICN